MPAFHMINSGSQIPGVKKRIEICHDYAKTTIWLQLTNTEYIVGRPQSSRFVTVLIGAVRQGDNWVTINAGVAARCRDITIAIGNNLDVDTGKFQKAIVDHWSSFNSVQAWKWAKGTTLGTSYSSASFVMKALKTGFDAIGRPMQAYSGFRRTDFTIDEVVAYVNRRSAEANTIVFDGGLLEFEEVGPSPAYTLPYQQDLATISDPRVIQIIPSARSQGHRGHFAYQQETSAIPFKRVITYGFRGDSRPPSAIRNSGGFLPNYTRSTHIEKHKNAAQNQALNLESFIANQEYGGYLSVSKSIAVAKAFATGKGGTTGNVGPGWVYACFAEGGFHLPAQGDHAWVKYNEQEISVPGIIDWDDVVGCRYVLADGNFGGNVYLKSALIYDPPAHVVVWELLSGKSQSGSI